MRILFAAFVIILFAALNAFGDDYSYRDGHYYKDSVPYERWAYYYPYYDYYGHKRYRVEYTYERAYPKEQPKTPQGRPDYAQMRVELAKAMKVQVDAIAKERELAFEHSAYLELLEASGLKDTLKYKINPTYPLTSGYTQAYATGTQYGAHGIQGQTVYGYGSQFQADLYSSSALDVNLAMQAGSQYLKQSQELTGDGFARMSDIIAQSTAAQAARQERFMELLMRQDGLRQYYQSLKPQDKLRITQKEFRAGPAPDSDVMATVLRPACAMCHTGPKAAGGWDVESYPGMSLADKASTVWKRILADRNDPIHMPKSKDGGPGPQLSPAAIKKVLSS